MYRNILGLCLIILLLLVGLSFAENKKPNPHVINSSFVWFSEEDVFENEGVTVFEVLRPIIFWLSPGIFFVGVLLILYGNYRRFEAIVDVEMGIRKKIFPKLESNIYTFHEWLLRKHILLGLICIVCALIFFLTLK